MFVPGCLSVELGVVNKATITTEGQRDRGTELMSAWRVLLSATSGRENFVSLTRVARLKAATSPPFNDVMKRNAFNPFHAEIFAIGWMECGGVVVKLQTPILEVPGSKLHITMTTRCKA
jgi:hypothetical protein